MSPPDTIHIFKQKFINKIIIQKQIKPDIYNQMKHLFDNLILLNNL